RRCRLPIDSAVNNLPHALEPPLGATEAALTATEKAGGTSETHFQLCMIHIHLSFCTIVNRALGHILSKPLFSFLNDPPSSASPPPAAHKLRDMQTKRPPRHNPLLQRIPEEEREAARGRGASPCIYDPTTARGKTCYPIQVSRYKSEERRPARA